MTLEAGDAGQLIKGLFAFDSIKGGDLKLVANLPGRATDADPAPGNTPDYQGTLDIDNFQVLNQPLLARLFSAGSFTGLGDLMGGGGISLEKMTVPFNSKNNVIGVRGAIARGRAVGATADGYVDRPKNQLALKGSLIPAYGINSLFGNIPVLGSVLGSKKGEGLFAATYSATGNADEPKIESQSAIGAGAGYLAPDFPGQHPQFQQCTLEPDHRQSAGDTVDPAQTSAALKRFHQNVLLPAAREFQHAIAVERG